MTRVAATARRSAHFRYGPLEDLVEVVGMISAVEPASTMFAADRGAYDFQVPDLQCLIWHGRSRPASSCIEMALGGE